MDDIKIEKKPFNVFGKEIKHFEVSVPPGSDFMGEYFTNEEEIHVDVSLSQAQKDHTEVHELLHATTYRAGLSDTAIPSDVWEVIVDQFATVLLENYNLIRK